MRVQWYCSLMFFVYIVSRNIFSAGCTDLFHRSINRSVEVSWLEKGLLLWCCSCPPRASPTQQACRRWNIHPAQSTAQSSNRVSKLGQHASWGVSHRRLKIPCISAKTGALKSRSRNPQWGHFAASGLSGRCRSHSHQLVAAHAPKRWQSLHPQSALPAELIFWGCGWTLSGSSFWIMLTGGYYSTYCKNKIGPLVRWTWMCPTKIVTSAVHEGLFSLSHKAHKQEAFNWNMFTQGWPWENCISQE